MKVGEEGLRWARGAGGLGDSEITKFENALGLPAIHRAQAGLIGDMDYISDVIYDRLGKSAAKSA
jgi:hypothetical protein